MIPVLMKCRVYEFVGLMIRIALFCIFKASMLFVEFAQKITSYDITG